jgi:predicted amidohydrolase YtcJ
VAGTLLVNARVLTMDPARPTAEAIDVRNGRIHAVGDGAALLADRQRDARVVDMRGQTALPGFVDAHTHWSGTVLEPRCVDLTSAADIPAIQSLVRAAASASPRGAWIRAFGYDEFRLRERRHPTRAELDEAAPDCPVVVLHWTYHRAVANSPALALAGLRLGHTCVPYGIVECDARGEPIGIVAEAATNALQRLSISALAERHGGELLDLVAANGQRHLALGITAVQDAWAPPDSVALVERAAAAGKLPLYYSPLRGSARGLFDSPAAWLDATDLDADRPPRIRRGGIKFFADGAGVASAMSLPAPDGSCIVDEGILFYPAHELGDLVTRAQQRGLVVAIHAVGNRAIATALAAVAQARAASAPSDGRIRIEHFMWPTEADVARARVLDVAVVAQPDAVRQIGDRLLAARRPEYLLRFPLARLLAAGVPLASSSDAPCFAMPPLWGVAAAIERRTAAGVAIAEGEALSVTDALRAATLGAAWAGGTDEVEGSISPGKLANFAVLGADPRELAPSALRALAVEETWVDGEVAYRRPPPERP